MWVRRLGGRRRGLDAAYRLVGSSVATDALGRPRRPRRRPSGDRTRDTVTTVYLHRGLAHRSLTLHPVAAVPVPVRDLDHDRDAAPRVGRGAPQAPRRDRHRRRSAQPRGRRVLAGAARQRRALQEGRERPGEHAEVRARHPRRPRSTSSRSTTRSSASSIGIAILVVGDDAARLPAVGRLPRGRDPRGAAT